MSKYKEAWKQMRSIVFEEPDNDYANDLVRQIVYRKLLRLKMIKYENGEFIWDKLEKSDTSKENCTIEQHEEIHYLRDKLKQTQKECDEWKARAEKGESLPKTKDLRKIAKVLGVTIDELIQSFER